LYATSSAVNSAAISNVINTSSQFEGIWFQALSSNYCVKHWTAVADVDELLMYHSCESVNLRALSKVMSARDQKVLNTFLLDVYPKGPLSSSSSDALKHEYYDFDESVPASQRNPPNFALKDGFYDCHKEVRMARRGAKRRAETIVDIFPYVMWLLLTPSPFLTP
jgi:hypothetical protein